MPQCWCHIFKREWSMQQQVWKAKTISFQPIIIFHQSPVYLILQALCLHLSDLRSRPNLSRKDHVNMLIQHQLSWLNFAFQICKVDGWIEVGSTWRWLIFAQPLTMIELNTNHQFWLKWRDKIFWGMKSTNIMSIFVLNRKGVLSSFLPWVNWMRFKSTVTRMSEDDLNEFGWSFVWWHLDDEDGLSGGISSLDTKWWQEGTITIILRPSHGPCKAQCLQMGSQQAQCLQSLTMSTYINSRVFMLVAMTWLY